MNAPRALPYVVGQWVSGARFYGRERLLAELLASSGDWHWLAGLRRVGKTSLLKQLEQLSLAEGEGRLPLFWDLQGVESREDLALGLGDALLDGEEALERLGISVDLAETEDPLRSLARLAGKTASRGAMLLLLLDEADDLAALGRREPGLAKELWATLIGTPRTRVVMASSIRLAAGERGWLGGDGKRAFGGPRLLGVLEEGEARCLLLQDQLPPDVRPEIPDAELESLLSACGRHPMLLQMAGRRYLEAGNAEEALRQMESDRAVHHLLAVDFELMSPEERRALEILARGGLSDGGVTGRLEELGVLQLAGGNLEVSCRFLSSWLLSKTS
ncbi:MAG: hypothetical protein KDD47_14545 [Acidobacteria bacterium]|nr:hypothetical protein [Acidobacteriota bacterium]